MLEICSITPVLNAHFWNWRRHNFQWHNRASASPHWQDGQLCIDFSIWQPYCAGHISFDSSGTVTVASGAPRALYHGGISPHAARRSGRLRRVRHGFALRAMSLRDGIPLPYGDSLHRIMLSFVKLSLASTVMTFTTQDSRLIPQTGRDWRKAAFLHRQRRHIICWNHPFPLGQVHSFKAYELKMDVSGLFHCKFPSYFETEIYLTTPKNEL